MGTCSHLEQSPVRDVKSANQGVKIGAAAEDKAQPTVNSVCIGLI